MIETIQTVAALAALILGLLNLGLYFRKVGQ
jgi:hypothetical protein